MADMKIKANAVPGKDGEKYIPYEKRTGNESIVYFTRDLSPEGLQKIYERVNGFITGKVAIKLHTGEKDGPNIIPRPWVKHLVENEPALKDAVLVDTNTFYPGDRDSTEKQGKCRSGKRRRTLYPTVEDNRKRGHRVFHKASCSGRS